MARALLVLLIFALAHAPAAAIQPSRPTIAFGVGTLKWDDLAPPGMAVIVVSDRLPSERAGSVGYRLTLTGPRSWNEGKALELYTGYTPISDRRGYRVWWYVFPETRPVEGEYRLETTPGAGSTIASAKFDSPGTLPRSAWVVANTVARGEVNAVWSLVAGAKSYGVAVLGPDDSLVPHDTSSLSPIHSYTTVNSTTFLRTTSIRRRVWPHRIELVAFNVDLTKIPPALPAQLNVSWRLSPVFEFR